MIYDLTPPISTDLAVFPGDKKFSRNVVMSMQKGAHLDLSWIESTLHIGAHADSSSHYTANGQGVDKRDLSYYLGPVQLIRPTKKSNLERLQIQDIQADIIAPRVLFDTGTFTDPNQWNSAFQALSPELIDYLATKSVCLVGLDSPSVDPETSKDLPSHLALARNNMAVLEGLVLKHVPEGLYNLIALPLPIVGGDASPVRAILIPKDSSSFFESLQVKLAP